MISIQKKTSGHRNVRKTTNLSGNLTLTGGVLHPDCHRLCNEKQLRAQDETTWWSMCRLARGCHIGKVGDPGWKDLVGYCPVVKDGTGKSMQNGHVNHVNRKINQMVDFRLQCFDYGTGEPFQNAGLTPPR